MDKNTLKKLAGITESKASDSIIASLAKKHFDVQTLQTRNSDSLDFYSVSVSSIKAALEAAYSEGYKDGFNQAPKRK
jgi:hypothetical protein